MRRAKTHSNNIEVFHIIDSPKRDLEWRIMLAYKLQKYGINSYIAPFNYVRAKMLSNGGGIICGRLGGTSARSNTDKEFISEMSKYPFYIFYYHDEGGLLNLRDYEREARLIYPYNLLDKNIFRKIYFWGKAQEKIFKNEKWIKKSKIIGSPRIDIYDKSLLMKKSKKEKKYILITTRFSSVNSVPDDPNSLSKRMLEIRLESGEAKNKDINQIISAMFEKWSTVSHDFISFTLMVSKICIRFKDIDFVLRPHPAENVEWYKTNLINLKNLTIMHKGDLRHMFKNSLLLINSDCTSGLEAELYGLPTINYRPKRFNDYDTTSGVNSLGNISHTPQEVIDLVEKHISGTNKLAMGKGLNKLKKYIFNIDRLGFATDQISKDIFKFISLKNFRTYPKFNSYIIYLNIKNWLREIFYKYKYKNKIRKSKWPKSNQIMEVWKSLGGDSRNINISRNQIYIKKNY